MNKMEVVKAVVNTVITIGVGSLFGNIAKAHTPSSTKFLGKACIAVSAWVIGDMVSELASKHVEKTIDKATEQNKNMATDTNV